jgi:hypothetical protein
MTPSAIPALRRWLSSVCEAWHEGVYVNELRLRGTTDPTDELHWRRRRGGWTLDGSMPPRPSGDQDA